MYLHFASMYKAKTIDQLIMLMEVESCNYGHSGQFTILRSEIGYKVTFGSPDVSTKSGRAWSQQLQLFDSLKDALVHCLAMAAIGKSGMPDPKHPQCEWCQKGLKRDREISGGVWHLDEDLPGQAFKCLYTD